MQIDQIQSGFSADPLGSVLEALRQLLRPSMAATLRVCTTLRHPGYEFSRGQQPWSDIRRAIEQLAAESDETALTWLDVCHRLRLDSREEQCLAAIVGHMPEQMRSCVDASVPHDALSDWAWVRHSALTRFRLVQVAAAPGAPVQVVAYPEVVDCLSGSFRPGRELLAIETLPHQTPDRELTGMIRTAADHRSSLGGREFAVAGVPGSGRRLVAGQLALALRLRGLWLFDLPRALALECGDSELRRACTMAVLSDAAVLVEGIEDCEAARKWSYRVRELLGGDGPVLIWKLSASPPEWLSLHPDCIVRLPVPRREQRLTAWQAATQGLLSAARQAELAGRFLLSVGQIEAAACMARNEIARNANRAHGNSRMARGCDDERERFERFCQAARSAAGAGIGALAQAETSNVRLDSLVLDDTSRSLLDELLSYCRYRHALAHEMGFAESLPYGLGVTALFTGPPGTGKSHAANAIARELQRELYRVDLSQLVSKYIGETEKHLSQLFDAAQGNDVMLLFDEADAIFAKRTEVKSSIDRYANLEVGYLLQRIERFDGLVILTTNHEASIDEAFQRRIRFRIAFDLPDEEARSRLWQVTLPRALRLSNDVDFGVLARNYELSGGHIKEAVLRAAGLALGEARGVATQAAVGQRHLLRAVEAEYKKLGKLPPSLPIGGGLAKGDDA